MSREEVLTILRDLAQKLGRTPNFTEVQTMTPLRRRVIRRYFGSYTWALREAGVGNRHSSNMISTDELFAEWARITRELKKIPSMKEFEEASKYTVGPYQRRFRHWSRVPEGMDDYMRKRALGKEWPDVLSLIVDNRHDARPAPVVQQPMSHIWPVAMRPDRPIYGPSMLPTPFMHEPINEIGVVFLFGTLVEKLGWLVTLMQTEFLDGEAFVQVAPGRWQRIRIEFEYESRSFLKHGHDPKGCDLIVCWEHNWPECPMEVLELKKLIMGR